MMLAQNDAMMASRQRVFMLELDRRRIGQYSKDSVWPMRIRLIIYVIIVALALDVGLNDGSYLKLALRRAQYGGEHIGDEVDNALSQPFHKAVLGLRRPND